MKNITLAIDDEVYRQARIRAAELGTSISALVAKYLQQLSAGESDFERLQRLQDETLASIRAKGGFDPKNRLSRDELHDRANFR